jgi:pyrimidine operon attenuation protein/uracil phosphoribosyltransferase
MDAAKIRRTLARLAMEIVEANRGVEGLALVGIRTRGVPLAERLAKLIEKSEGAAPPVGIADITLYRDDLSSISEAPLVRSTELPFRVGQHVIVLVDDVLFTGRTIRAAMDEVLDFGRPKSIRLAVLVDRGHRELPIQADFVGTEVSTRVEERVEVRLAEIDGTDEVTVEDQSAPRAPSSTVSTASTRRRPSQKKPSKPEKNRKTGKAGRAGRGGKSGSASKTGKPGKSAKAGAGRKSEKSGATGRNKKTAAVSRRGRKARS